MLKLYYIALKLPKNQCKNEGGGTFALASMGDDFLYSNNFPGMGCFSMIENLPGRRFSMGEALLYDTGKGLSYIK